MTTFLAIYRGESVAGARLVAVSADPILVADVSSKMLNDPQQRGPGTAGDRVINELDRARRSALRSIQREARGELQPA